MKKQYLLFGGKIGAKNGGYKGTGFTAKDNNWRFEINDENIKLVENINKILSKEITQLPLTHFLSHRNLFKYYPEFRNIHVFFHPISQYRKLNPTLSEVSLPEIIASFDYTDRNKPTTYQLIYYINYETVKITQTTFTTRQAVQLFLQRGIAELQHAIQSREGFEEERGISYYVKRLRQDVQRARNKALELPTNSIERIEYDNFVNYFSNKENFMKRAYNEYIEQFSEQESRESMNRMSLSDEERKNIKPSIQKDSKKDGGIIDTLNKKVNFEDLF